MEKELFIPKGCLASDIDAAKAKREALKKKLLSGDKISLKPGTGNAMQGGGGSDSSISIPAGKLAVGEDAAKAKREALKKKLLSGDKISLKPGTGNAMQGGGGSDSSISIPAGKLAAQWYQTNPTLYEAEKAAMSKCFPNFELGILDDGRMYWFGELSPGIYETKYGIKKSYHVMAVYQNNHPCQQMGSSVYVYLVQPEVEDIVAECGFCPSHLLRDASGEVYLCTTEAGDVKTGSTVTTAASVLLWASKWLIAYELVLTGDLPKEKFNEHHGI